MAQSIQQYSIGWICPLAKEFTAARTMLDEDHGSPPIQVQPHDTNQYVLGKVGSHSVVMACLPERHFGTSLARDVANKMIQSFPGIEYFLVVGIGGAVPNYGSPGDKRDIMLGDVVVGTSIIQSGFGKQSIHGFRIDGNAISPPLKLLTAVTRLRSDHEMARGTRIPEFLSHMLGKISEAKRNAYKYQGDDRLYPASYPHQTEGMDCAQCCDPAVSETRSRSSSNPEIHYGRIASADHLMTNASMRDALQAEHDVICFEMEAAGMCQLPFLAIRGVCDYADSHKNKKWQEYAAVTAAAYAKELLLTITPKSIALSTVLSHSNDNQHWFVPRSKNPYFTGQGQLLAKLQKRLLPTYVHNHGQHRPGTFVIYGIGGIGKSEICIKFADEHRGRYWGVFWVDATDSKSAERSFAKIAKLYRSSEASIDDTRHWLANIEQSWLLIIDNADNPEFDYSSYFPSGGRGTILMTSRSPDCKVYQNVGSEELTRLDDTHARQLLLKASEIEGELWGSSMADAAAVVKILEGHTLAIIQAGTFIQRRYCTLREYPNKFRKHRQELWKVFPRQAQSRYKTVYATFEVSAKYLEQSDQEKHLRAIQLLKILAFMHLNQVSESIFIRAAKHMHKVVAENRDGEDIAQLYSWHLDTVSCQILPEVSGGDVDTYQLCEARDMLASLSLIKISGAENEISMHPLIHAWARDRMMENSAAQRAEWERAATLLAFSTEESHAYQHYFPDLHPHIAACLYSCPADITRAIQLDPKYAQIFYRFVYVRGFLSPADGLSQTLVEVFARCIDQSAVSERNLTHAKWMLALGLMDCGDYKRAITLLEEVVPIWGSTLPEDNRDRLNSQQELARALMEVDQNQRAVVLLEEVVQIQNSTLPKDNRDRLVSQHVLASALMEVGQNQRALELLDEIVQIENSTLPEDSRDRLASQHELARALMEVGQNQQAVALLEEVVQIQNSTLPEDNRDRLASQHVLASALMGVDQNQRAVALLEEVVQIQNSTLPEDNRNRLASQHVLACALINVGQNQRAVALLEEVVQIQNSTLPEDNRYRLASQRVLARELMNVGQNQRAFALLEEVVRIRSSAT